MTVATRWCRTAGTRELGPVQDSGLRSPTYLLRRGDGQVVQVSELLHLVVREVSVDRSPTQVAGAVSAACGRELTVAGLRRLITTKLAPMGLVEQAGGRPAPGRVPRADPLLALRFRGTLLPSRWVRPIARGLAPAFRPPVVAAALAGLVVLDVVLVRRAACSERWSRCWRHPCSCWHYCFCLPSVRCCTSSGTRRRARTAVRRPA